jgi:hypothetical protein
MVQQETLLVLEALALASMAPPALTPLALTERLVVWLAVPTILTLEPPVALLVVWLAVAMEHMAPATLTLQVLTHHIWQTRQTHAWILTAMVQQETLLVLEALVLASMAPTLAPASLAAMALTLAPRDLVSLVAMAPTLVPPGQAWLVLTVLLDTAPLARATLATLLDPTTQTSWISLTPGSIQTLMGQRPPAETRPTAKSFAGLA